MTTSDFGLRVSLRVQHGPLWTLSPRALRLWIFLSMKGQHATFSRELRDGQRVNVMPGQVLTSTRGLLRDAGYRSLKAVVADLDELSRAKTINMRFISRQRSQNGNASVSKSETQERSQNGNAGMTVANLITVHGINQLRDQSVSKSETKRNTGGDVLTARERAENARADELMAMEGR